MEGLGTRLLTIAALATPTPVGGQPLKTSSAVACIALRVPHPTSSNATSDWLPFFFHAVEVTEVTTTQSERDRVNVAAIIGGLLVMALLVSMLVLFAMMIVLYLMRKREKYSPEQAYYDEMQRSNGELSVASSLEKKPELSEGSIHTETQIHNNSEGSVHSEGKPFEGRSVQSEAELSEGASSHTETKLCEGERVHMENKLTEGGSVHSETKLSEGESVESETKPSEEESVHTERSAEQPGERATNVGTAHLSELL